MNMRVPMILSVLCWTASASVAAADPAQPSTQTGRPKLDPNQRICEDVTQVGSRLATKRICATRSEWAAQKKADRETVDAIQRSPNTGCSAVGTLSPTPGC